MAKKSAKAEAPPKGTRGPYNTSPEKLAEPGTGGIFLRQWRVFRKMNVAELAKRANLSIGAVADIEGGKVGWSWETLLALAAALETSAGALLGVNPLADREFWSIWTVANEQQRQRITDYAMGVVPTKE